jgi:hypothetical protein
MVYIITALKTTPQFPEHATRFANIKDAEKAIKDLAEIGIDWMDCKIVDEDKYNEICIQHPMVLLNSRCHDTQEQLF